MRTRHRRRPFWPEVRRSFRPLIIALFNLLWFCNDGAAQIQQAWVAKYDNSGITNGEHRALKMALGTDGNIYVCGFSQNANSNLDYAVLKYGPNGNLFWASRFDSTNTMQAAPRGFVLDISNNSLIMGNAGTVKYDAHGDLLWMAPYTGLSCASDTNGNSFITFGTNFNTVKISPSGTNLWTQTYVDVGPTVAQAVAVDAPGNAYVAGSDLVGYLGTPPFAMKQFALRVTKYSPAGSVLWSDSKFGGALTAPEVKGMQTLAAAIIYLLGSYSDNSSFDTLSYAANGQLLWSATPNNGSGPANALAVAPNANVYLAGQNAYAFNSSGGYNYYSVVYILNAGNVVTTDRYPQPPVGSTAANSITIDNRDNACVTGYSQDSNGTNDIVTIACDTNGKQLWMQRYAGLGYGAVGNAIATDNNGNVYVAGYENVPGGGSEMVLIKYSPVTLQHQSNGNFLLQAQGSPNEPFDIQTTTNLQTWLDLGTQDADTNGLLQYLDTNAPLFPWRFYLAVPK